MEEFGTTLIALTKVVLSFQSWNQHRRFGPHCHLGQILLESIEHVWYVKANKNIDII
jgi:hypothetical protein